MSGCQMVMVERRSQIELMAQDGLHRRPNRVQMKAELWEISLGKTDESDLLGEAWKADRVLPICSCCRAPHRMVLALPYHRFGLRTIRPCTACIASPASPTNPTKLMNLVRRTMDWAQRSHGAATPVPSVGLQDSTLLGSRKARRQTRCAKRVLIQRSSDRRRPRIRADPTPSAPSRTN